MQQKKLNMQVSIHYVILCPLCTQVENFQPGYYYCSIIEVGETLASSTRTQWSVPGSYGGLPPCSTQGGQYQLGVPSTTCAKEVPDTGPFQFVTQVFETMQDATADVQRLLSPSFSGVPAHASTPTPIPTHTPSAVPPPAGSNAGNNSLLWIIIAPAVAVTALMVLLTLIITVIFWRIKRGKKTSKAGTRDSLRPLNREIQVRNGKDACLCMCLSMYVCECTTGNQYGSP